MLQNSGRVATTKEKNTMKGGTALVRRTSPRVATAVGLVLLLGALGLVLSRRFWATPGPASAAQARAALAAGRYAEARMYLDRWIADRPDQGEPHYLRAESAWKQGQLEGVPADLTRARELGYPASRIDRLWGLVLSSSGRGEEAEPLLHAAWDESAGRHADNEVAEALAKVAMQRFELGFALEVLERWAIEAPSNPRPLVWRAQVERRNGASRSALMASYEEALRRDPGCDEAQLGLAELYYLMGKHSESASAYAAYASRHPEDPAGQIGVGLNALVLGDESRAVTAFDRVLATEPDNTLALRQRAAVDLRRGRLEDALHRLERAVAADPFDPELRYQRSLAFGRLGRRDEAAADLSRSQQLRREHGRMDEIRAGLAADPRNIPLRLEAARWMLEHGRAEEGVIWARMVLRDQPDQPEANRLLADYHQNRGEQGLANHYRIHAAPAVPATATYSDGALPR